MSNIFETMSTCLKGEKASESDIEAIPSYIFLRWLSGNPNTVTIANIINAFDKIPILNQYQIIRTLFHNKIRYIAYPKNVDEKIEKKIEYLADYFKISMQRAKEYYELISKEELDKIVTAYEKLEKRNK